MNRINGNCLVNAMTAGIVKADKIFKGVCPPALVIR